MISRSNGVLFNGTGANLEGLSAARIDHLAQEDAIELQFASENIALAFIPEGAQVDWSSSDGSEKALAFAFRSDADTILKVSMGCGDELDCEETVTVQLAAGDWREVQIPLACFADKVDMAEIDKWLGFSSTAGSTIGLADVRTANANGSSENCE